MTHVGARLVHAQSMATSWDGVEMWSRENIPLLIMSGSLSLNVHKPFSGT
jgi:hypothetical protein